MAFERIKNFLVRHKNKFIFGGMVFGASVFLTKYGKKRIKEWQEKETRDFLERAKKSQHFESTENTCNQTILNLAPSLVEALNRVINTEPYVLELQNSTNDRVKIWENFKIIMFTKLVTLIYSSAILTLTLRIQLNLIGGYMYKDAEKIDGAIQKKYLSLVQEFLQNGVEKLTNLIHSKTVEVVGPIDLKKRLSLYNIEQIFWAIQAKLCEVGQKDPIHKIRDFFIEENINNNSTNVYDDMLKETADLFESEEIFSIVTSLINRGFAITIDKLTDFYTPGLEGSTSSREARAGDAFIHPSKIELHLVRLIPILNTFLNSSKNLTDQILQAYILDSKLKILGANIYEAFGH